MNRKKKTIFVGMSGGVDSSVAAALLSERDEFDVVGCYIRCWSGPTCRWEDDIHDARSVTKKLRIPFYVMNLEEEYRERVVGEMLREYESGRTPNPDVACNREIKFGLFLEKAKTLGADMVATGHYARVKEDKDGIYNLKAGKDLNKDQSYFLWTLRQDQLRHTLFPVGEYTKPEVRQIAESYKLSTAGKKDSQGVCFIGEIDVQQFLREHIKQEEGAIITKDGKEIGKHDGAWFYTIGQRQGLGIGGGTPLYVVATDKELNTVTVGEDDDPALFASTLQASAVHWISGSSPKQIISCKARIRYRQLLQRCTVENHGKKVFVSFQSPQRAITPGQSVVFYDGDVLLGGAIIESVLERSDVFSAMTREDDITVPSQ